MNSLNPLLEGGQRAALPSSVTLPLSVASRVTCTHLFAVARTTSRVAEVVSKCGQERESRWEGQEARRRAEMDTTDRVDARGVAVPGRQTGAIACETWQLKAKLREVALLSRSAPSLHRSRSPLEGFAPASVACV